MAVRDIYQLHHPRDTADLTDQFNRLMHRLMARLDGSDSELSATLATLTADLAELLSDFGAHNHAFVDLSDVDFTDEAHGDILFRGASAWESLPAGEDGQILTTHGVDADPTWETAAAGGLQELLVADITAPIELAAINDPEDGDTILTYDSAGKFTVYCYETDATGDSPFVVSGWVAVAGEYSELSLNTHQLLVDTEPTEPNHVVRLADVTAGYWPAGYWPTGYWP